MRLREREQGDIQEKAEKQALANNGRTMDMNEVNPRVKHEGKSVN